MPAGEELLISSSEAVQGRTTEKTFCSRMRRAISCEYCAPKSRTTIACVSTIYFARGREQCKAGISGKQLAVSHQLSAVSRQNHLHSALSAFLLGCHPERGGRRGDRRVERPLWERGFQKASLPE